MILQANSGSNPKKVASSGLEEIRGEGILAAIVRELCGNHSPLFPIKPISESEQPLFFLNLFGCRWG
jgi:hypothetical protein